MLGFISTGMDLSFKRKRQRNFFHFIMIDKIRWPNGVISFTFETSKFIYQKFWLIFIVRKQMNVNGGSFNVRRIFIKIAQKFEHQIAVGEVIALGWFQSLQKCGPIEWFFWTLCNPSFC